MEGFIILVVSFAVIAWLFKKIPGNYRGSGYTPVRSYKKKDGTPVRSHTRRKRR